MSTDIARSSRFSRGESASAAAYVREAALTRRGEGLVAAVASSRGKQHAVNEDGYSTLDASAPLFVVADGVGSGAMASCASRELVSRLHAALTRDDVDEVAIANALLDADSAIQRSIASRTDSPGAATVALCVATDASLSRWLVAWVGDCRAYRLSAAADAAAELLTVDDTYRHLNEASPPGGSPDDPARMVGNGAVDAPNVRSVALSPDEMLVLCSDGVHRHAEGAEMARLLHGTSSLSRRCVRLIEFVRAHGGRDDATVLVVHRAPKPRARGSHLARVVSIAVSIVVLAGVVIWLAADRATAQRLAPQSHPLTSQVQP
jgi:serine/threonine protein phosphatase PrpC